MKILIFYQYFGTPKGSWSTRMYEMCRNWVRAGAEVTVITSPYEKSDIQSDKFIDRQTIEGINVIVINSADSNRESTIKRGLKAIVFSVISVYFSLRLKYDVILASSGPITVGFPTLVGRWFRRKPMVFEVRDLWPDGAIELGKLNNGFLRKAAVWFEKCCYKYATLVVPCSKGMEEGVIRKYAAANTLVIPNACDVDLFSNRNLVSPDLPEQLKLKKVFLYIGSLGLMDDCSQIINGMANLSDPDIALVFIGDGAERGRLEVEAEASGNPNIFFLGLKPKTEVARWLSIATATFVTFKDFPVLHTSSPNKMFDSFAGGVPIIQSTKGWIKELVEDERCGINVNPDRPIEFANAMVEMTRNESLRSELSSNALRLANTTFNRTILAERYLNALKEIAN